MGADYRPLSFMKLSTKDRQFAKVMVDLFMKGTPERRIGEYLRSKGLTLEQVNSLLWKLEGLTASACEDIREAYKAAGYDGPDWSRVRGKQLQEWLDFYNKV